MLDRLCCRTEVAPSICNGLLAGTEGSAREPGRPAIAFQAPEDRPTDCGACTQILWNGQTQHYVLFFHCDTPEFAYPAVGIARAQNITGPYTWVRVAALGRPNRSASVHMCRFHTDAAAFTGMDRAGCAWHRRSLPKS